MSEDLVKHGRRRGLSRNTPTMPNGAHMPMVNEEDLRQVTIFSKADWDRIQYQLNRRAIEEEKRRRIREEKEKHHAVSKDMMKNWNNTIAGQRQKKLEARKLREEKEEEEKRQIDIDEAKFQAAKRKEAIEKAKTQQYYQTDRVKGFHGALLLTEVLKERDAQLELKKLKEKVSDGKDQEYLEKAQRDYEAAIMQEQETALQRIKQTRETAAFQKAQVREHLQKLEIEKRAEDVEGSELKKLAVQYNQEKKRLEQIRAEESKTLMSDNLQQIQDVHKMKLINEQQEEEENEECRIFAAAKRKMMKLRAAKEKDLHNEKQVRLEKIRERLNAQMQQKIDDEDDRIKLAEQEREQKNTKEDAEKDAKIRKTLQEIAEHRHQQMKEREEKAAEERRKLNEMLMIRKEADTVFRRNEEEKSSKRFSENKDLQKFLELQMNERRAKSCRTREEQLALDKRNQELVKLEEDQFQEYAKKVIDHCEKGGRNTYPLRRAAEEGAGGGLGPVFPGKGGVRPSYMVCDQTGVQLPNYQRDTTDETKKNIYGEDQTQNRLGFVW